MVEALFLAHSGDLDLSLLYISKIKEYFNYFIKLIADNGRNNECRMKITCISHFSITISSEENKLMINYPVPLSITTTLLSIIYKNF